MLEPCDFCSGTRWLSDEEELGPCVCVTAENMRELDEALGTGDSEERLEDVADALSRYFVRLGFGVDPIMIDDPDLKEAWEKIRG